MEKIRKAVLMVRLAKKVPLADDLDPKKAFEILFYGWRKARKFGEKYSMTLLQRDFLYITEVMDLSKYAGVDLAEI